MFDLMIRGGTLIDGTGQARRTADVAVNHDRIAAIGQLAGATAHRTIDAAGLCVAPGFVDVHNHDEGWLLRERHLLHKTTQGFTTEILMSDGISYAPLEPETARDWIYYLRSLDSLLPSHYSGWRTVADYLALLDRSNVQNTAALVPYANLRVLACGWGRAPADDAQVNVMRRECQRALDGGAVGLSTGLDYISECFATTDELVRVVEVMAPFGAPYVTHVRYKRGTLWGVQEAVEIGRRAGVPVHISHLKSGSPRETDELLTYIDQVAVHEVDFSFDIYPYLPGSTLLCSLLPYEVWEQGPLSAPAMLRDPLVRRRFDELMRCYPLPLEQITIAWVGSHDNQSLVGMSLAEVVARSAVSVGDALADLLLDEMFAVLTVFHVGDDRLVEPFLKHPRQMVGSDGIWFPTGRYHPRATGTATRILGPLVRERKLFSLEEAVFKLAGFPAQRFGLTDRGVIREGAFADLVVFDAERVTDLATYDQPQRLSVGIAHLIVNGTPVLEEGQPVAAAAQNPPGRALRFRE
ncbi:MAG: D-aminoacylase [Pirellulales bacterium]|nr:D-aminoacylase [Pirellulales bacterium]